MALLLCCVSVLSSCGAPRLKYDADENGYVRAKDGEVFVRAGSAYAAVGIDTEKEIARIEQDGEDLLLYQICSKNGEMDVETWMASKDYSVYCKKGTVLPKLWEMQVSEAHVIQSTSASFIIAYITDGNELGKLVDVCQNGKSFPLKTIEEAYIVSDVTKYNLACTSTLYEGLYYMLFYYRFEKDVKVTEYLDSRVSASDFTPTYDAPYTLRQGEDGNTIAEYNFGKNIVQDRLTGACYIVRGVFESHFDKES